MIYSLLILLLESTFITVVFGILHSQRNKIGKAPFYLAVGGVFFFALLASAADARFRLGWGVEFQIGTTFLFMPCLAVILLIYATEGTLSAQRLIIGEFVLFGILFYLTEITKQQGFSEYVGWTPILEGGGFEVLLKRMTWLLFAMASAHLLDLFILPIVFSLMRRLGGRIFFSVLCSMVISTISNTVIFLLIMYNFASFDAGFITGTASVRLLLALYIGCGIAWYFNRVESEMKSEDRRALDIVFSFIGGYSKAISLERSLRDWENRYSLLVEQAGEIIILLDPDGKICEINRAGTVFFQRPAEDMLEKKFSLFAAREQPEEDKHTTDGNKTGSREENHPVRERIKTLSRYDKEERHGEFSVSKMFLHNTEFTVLIGHDVTGEEKLERERDAMQEQLIHLQRIESLGQLAGGIAHDFNNHLHAMLGNLDMLSFSPAMKDDNVRKRVEKLISIAEQSGKLTSQLLGFARKGKYNPVRLDAAEVIRKSLELFQPKTTEDITVKVDIRDEGLFICGDLVQLQQVLINLMINAADAMRESREKLLTVGLSKEDNFAVISVADTGCGMSRETQNRIFDPFFTTKPVGEGTGMGLSMAYGAISHHQGHIEVNSKVGAGSVFKIYLPLMDNENTAD